MLDLTNAERSPWQRATALEFLRSICEDRPLAIQKPILAWNAVAAYTFIVRFW